MYKKQITYFTADGLSSGLTLFPNQNNPEADIILCLPAMGVNASYYQPFAEKLAAAGYHAVTADWRGKGLSVLRADRQVDFGYREILHYDFPAIFSRIRRLFPENRIIVYGHSLGGQLGSLYLAAHPEENVVGMVIHFACHCYYRNWGKQSWKYYLWFVLFPVIATLLGYFPGKFFGFAGKEARTFMRDWGYSGRKGKYLPEGLISDYDSLGENLRMPVLAFSLKGDRMAPRRGLEHLFGLFQNAPVTHFHLELETGTQKRFSHFNWIHQPEFFIEKMGEWSPAEGETFRKYKRTA